MDIPVHDLIISAVAFQDGDTWVIQGVNYDIVAHAADPADLPKALCRAVAENACITQQLGRSPMDGIPAAPARFQELFNKARTTLGTVEKFNSTDFPVSGMDIRLAHLAA